MCQSSPVRRLYSVTKNRAIERTTYAGCILSIFNSMNDLEKEVREIKRDVNYTRELKIDELVHACADVQ